MLQGPYLFRTVRVKAFIKMVSANKDLHLGSILGASVFNSGGPLRQLLVQAFSFSSRSNSHETLFQSSDFFLCSNLRPAAPSLSKQCLYISVSRKDRSVQPNNIQLQQLFHLLNTLKMSKFYALLGVTTPFDPSHTYTTSWLLPPLLLALIRSLLSLYAFITIFTIFGYDDSHHKAIESRQWFSYFTNLTYVGLAFYFLFSAVHTWSYWKTGKALLQSWPRPLQALHAVYYTTVVTFPFLVTIVYWGVLYKNPWFPVVEQAWSNVRNLSVLALGGVLLT